MKSDLWSRIKHVVVALLLVVLSAIALWVTVGMFRDHANLIDHGATVQGSLIMATKNKTNFITDGYTFTVQYLDQKQEFHVSRELYYTYVRDDNFLIDAPVSVVYLPENKYVSLPSEMLNVWVYWGSENYYIGVTIIFIFTWLHLKKTIGLFH